MADTTTTTTTANRPAHHLPVPRWTLAINGAQLLFAVVILGLAAYGVHYIAYYALIYSIVVVILTFAACAYIIGTTLFLHKVYNKFIVLFLHGLMIILWIIDLGLVANLAVLWSKERCTVTYRYGYYDYNCYYGKRDLTRRDTTVKSYYGALAAGAFFAAVELVLWAVSLAFHVLALNKHNASQSHPTHPPPAYPDNSQAIPMEQKYGQAAPQQPQPAYQQPQQQYSVPTPQQQYAQPAYQPQGQYGQQPAYNQQQQFNPPYAQDPVNRAQTVSPVSQAGYAPPHNASELQSPQHTDKQSYGHTEKSTAHHTGGYNYNSNISELSSPQHTGSHNPNATELATKS